MPNKIIPFPRKPAEEGDLLPQRIVCQIGNQRFAIEFTVTDLPPAPPPTLVIPAIRQRKKHSPGTEESLRGIEAEE